MCGTQQMQRQTHQQQQQMQQAQQQVQRNQNVQQQPVQAEQNEEIQREQEQRYQRFMNSLRPLPPLPAARDANAQGERATGKSQRRREKKLAKERADQYAQEVKRQQENPQFVDAQQLRDMSMFQTRAGQEQWKNQILPHSTKTRQQTLEDVVKRGDYSNFENLDLLMRNLVAKNALDEFNTEYEITAQSDPQLIVTQLLEKHDGVSGLLNPALRLGLSLAQRASDAVIAPELKTFYRRLDERMSTEVMVQTLIHQPQQDKVRKYFDDKAGEGADPAVVDAQTAQAISANRAQQIQIAKRLLLMQMSDFREIRTKKEDGSVEEVPWQHSMAVALSHCSRVVLTMPKTVTKSMEKDMWRSIQTTNGVNTAQDNKRASSTHSVERRSVGGGAEGFRRSKEKKKPFNFIGQHGMNCAIGGLGNEGISGKTIANDGSCGHFYSMYKTGDSGHYGVMLMGLESDASGVMNQMGHTHDIHATAEKASSLGGQRTDEIGDKYGGRQCDLSHVDQFEVIKYMTHLERTMTRWQENGETQRLEELMRLLAGEKLDLTQKDNVISSMIEHDGL